jgi:hypothetical protein
LGVLIIVSKNLHKIAKMNLINDMQNLQTPKYKTLLREIKEDLHKGKLSLWTGALSILKMTILSK